MARTVTRQCPYAREVYVKGCIITNGGNDDGGNDSGGNDGGGGDDDGGNDDGGNDSGGNDGGGDDGRAFFKNSSVGGPSTKRDHTIPSVEK